MKKRKGKGYVMINEEIRDELFRLRDPEYKAFQSRLLPTIDPETILGIRTPALRRYAAELIGRGDISVFLHALPHSYFDENQLHAFIVSGMKAFDGCIEEVCRFLPYVDNWATADQMSPRVFKKHRQELAEYIKAWIASGETYTVRFGIGMLMEHFLEKDFDVSCPNMVAGVRSEEYYVNMMIAWYFATALAKQYEAILPFIEGRRLAPWTHNMAIRKAMESFRIAPERKAYLKTLKIPGKTAKADR